MIGLITDSLGIFIGAFIGILLKKRITENHTQTIFTIMGIITIVLGLQGVIESDAILIVIISLFIGSILGVSFDIDYRVKRFAQRFTKGSFSLSRRNSYSIYGSSSGRSFYNWTYESWS